MIYLRFTSAIECEGDEQKQQQYHDILGCSAGKWRHNHRTSGKNIYSSEHQYNIMMLCLQLYVPDIFSCFLNDR